MKLIVGLGNPGLRYAFTRHNMGFRVIDELLERYNLKLDNNKFNGDFTKTKLCDEDVIIAKPMTFMNLSGEFIRPLADYYKIDYNDILVIYDELAIELGRIKLSLDGQSAGHNGVKSIIQNLNTEKFMRLRIGTGPCTPMIKIIDYVLMNFPKHQILELKSICERAVDAIEDLLKNGAVYTMDKYNRKNV